MAILVNPAQGILFAHCTFHVALSPPRFPAHWLPFASSLFYRLQTCVALRLFFSTCIKPPNPSTCPSFSTTAPAPIPIKPSHIRRVGPSSSLQNLRSPRLADWKKGGADIADLPSILILIAFITGNSSLEPLIEGLCAQIHVNLRWRVFGRNRTGGLTDH